MAKSKHGSKVTPRASTAKEAPTSPAPFSPASSSLQKFLLTLDPNHIYITSIDSHPRDLKRRIFAVPLLLNLFLTVVLIWRLQYAVPTYLAILTAILGYDSPAKVNTKELDATSILRLGAERAAMFIGDFVLARFIGMWPWGFFLGLNGEASPVGWRRWVGFRDVEIVIRRSRKWDAPLFVKDDDSGELRDAVNDQWLDQGQDGQTFAERVLPAVSYSWVKNKTGYLMLDKNWDLFFTGMLKAHALVDGGENKVEDYSTAVLVKSETLGWLSWEVWREHEDGSDNEGTKKLQRVKDKLTIMGKEHLFFRIIEVIQSETSQPGSFTIDRQKKAIKSIREEFLRREVDFDAFWADLEGIENMPGMEING